MAIAPDRDYEYEILARLEAHGAREGEALEAYKRVAEESDASEAVRYLVRLILEDEERHHQVFAEMANEVRSIIWEVDVEPKVPAMAARPDPHLLAATRRLLALETDDARELRRLSRAVRHGPPSSLHPLLVDLMRHDTAKHIAILEHIQKRLTRRGR